MIKGDRWLIIAIIVFFLIQTVSSLETTSCVAPLSTQTSATLRWNSIPDADFYFIQRYSEGYPHPIAFLPADETQYIDEGLQPGTEYFYIIHGWNNTAYINNYIGPGAVFEVNTAPTTPPSAPTQLDYSINAIKKGHVLLFWNDADPTVSGYEIYRTKDNGAETLIATTTNIPSYLDTENILRWSNYTYRVRAINSAGKSDYSEPKTANYSYAFWVKTNATVLNSHTVVLNWTTLTTTFQYSSISIIRWEAPFSSGITLKILDANNFSFVDTTVESGKSYVYQLQAIKDASSSNSYAGAIIPLPLESPRDVVGIPTDSGVVNQPGKISLRWQDSSNGKAEQFIIERESSSNPSWTQIAAIQATTPNANYEYTDTTVTAIELYSYRVIARRGLGDFTEYSLPSEITHTLTTHSSTLLPKLPIPPGFIARQLTSGGAKLEWELIPPSVSSFEVFRKESPSCLFENVDTLVSGQDYYLDRSIDSGKEYLFKLRGKGTAQYRTSEFTQSISHTTYIQDLAPSNLNIELDSPLTSARLTWHDNTPDESGFEVQRKKCTFEGDSLLCEDWIILNNEIVSEVTQYLDTIPPATEPTLYSYKVRALFHNYLPTAFSDEIAFNTNAPGDHNNLSIEIKGDILDRTGTKGGVVSITSPFINLPLVCPPKCKNLFLRGESITLIAQPSQGFALDNWEGCSSTTSSCAFQISGETYVNATFKDVSHPIVTGASVIAISGPFEFQGQYCQSFKYGADFEDNTEVALLTIIRDNIYPADISISTGMHGADYIDDIVCPGLHNITLTVKDINGLMSNSYKHVFRLNNLGLDQDGDNINDTYDICPNSKPGFKVNYQGCNLPINNRLRIPFFFEGVEDLFNVSNISFENVTYGQIYFGDKNISFVLFDENGQEKILDLDNNIIFSQSKVYLNATHLPMLNVPATITLYNISYTRPQILRDGAVCSDCVFKSYNNKIYTFSVPHFSTYEVIESSPPIIIGDDDDGGSGGSGGSGKGKPPIIANTSNNSQNNQNNQNNVNQVNNYTNNTNDDNINQHERAIGGFVIAILIIVLLAAGISWVSYLIIKQTKKMRA